MEKNQTRFYLSDGRYKYSLLYYSVCRAFRVFYDWMGRFEIAGTEHIPAQGAFLLASNHCSHLDPPLVGGQLMREVNFLARKTLWSSPFMSWMFDNLRCVPIDRDGGGADIAAFKALFKLIRAGEPIGVFPEGTRSVDGNLMTPKAGIGMLACKFGVPVVPARVFGTHEVLGSKRKPGWQHDLAVNYGAPLQPADFDPGPNHPDRYQEAANRIMAAIAKIQWPEPPKF